MLLSTLFRKSIILLAFILVLFTVGVRAQDSSPDIQSQAVSFIKKMLSGQAAQSRQLLAVKSESGKDSMIMALNDLQYFVMSELGSDLNFEAIGFNQTKVILGSENVFGNPTKHSYVQIDNNVHFTAFQVIFDQQNKIVSVNKYDQIFLIPDYKKYWLISIPFMLIVLGINMYAAIKVYKSSVTRKWLKYLMIIFLNLPVIGYHAVGGFFLHFLNLRLLGVGFSVANYFNTYWAIGIPIGAILVLWRLKNNLYRTKEDNWIYELANENEGL